jgi:YidC/Oxa1 family membrane protein insertase
VERRLVLFIVLSTLIFVGNIYLQSVLHPPAPKPVAAEKKDANGEKKEQPADDAAKKEGGNKAPENPNPEAVGADNIEAPEAPEGSPQWFTLISPELRITLTSRGAAVERIELTSPRFRDFEDRSGFLCHPEAEDVADGVKVNVVGPGTPADTAGLKPGDVITAIDNEPTTDLISLEAALKKTRPEQSIQVHIKRDGQPQTLSATLAWRPMEIVQPEKGTPSKSSKSLDLAAPAGHDPFSFLFTLHQVAEDQKLAADAAIDAELKGVELRNAHWNGRQIGSDTVEFTRALPRYGLEAVKRYRITKADDQPSGYQFNLEVELRNTGNAARKIAYQLDGPTGLPTEGWWYSSRPSRDWGGIGVRDVALMLQGRDPTLITPMQLVDKKLDPLAEDPSQLLAFAGVDAQYFASAMLPQPFKDRAPWLAEVKGILVGKLPEDNRFRTLGNVTCRLISKLETLEPKSEPLIHTYTVFAGPKQPNLLARYGDPRNNLGELIYYGWPMWAGVARLMTQVLHFFYSIIGNYGLAIIMLTVLVRGCMFPLSRKQALAAQKMQELKPEMDRINEKHKGKPEEKTRAMQELWRKHNYNPMSGCLLLFLQLPIFMGLYRALMVDVELRQAPLLGPAIRWCSNLAAPDMLFDWTGFMPSFITAYRGFGSLGPYLNILPLFTVALMIWQQKMFMPPATDEQTAMQQKMMKYMMVFIAFMFFTVPSGLCIYFISSSLWGIAEKKLLPKTIGPKNTSTEPGFWAKLAAAATPADGNGSAAAKRNRKKQRRK